MNNKKYVLPSILASVLSVACLTNVHAAGTLSGEIGVKLVIGASCTVGNGGVSTPGSNNWGTIDYGTQPNLINTIDAGVMGSGGTNAITVTCSDALSSSLTLSSGLYGSATIRSLSSDGTNRIPYRLYSNSARTTEIGINTAIPLVSNGSPQNIPIYGRILPTDQTNTAPANGSYNDTILATLSW